MKFQLWDVMDEVWSPNGLLRVVRAGNGVDYHVYGAKNFDLPLFSEHCGTFYEAQKKGLERLEKDLNQIFWILNEVSQKERAAGEPKDSELIEQAIRGLNGGDKKMALVAMDKIIGRERAEGEPGDVAQLQLARNLILAEKSVAKDETGRCPECGAEFWSPQEYEDHKQDCVGMDKDARRFGQGGAFTCLNCKKRTRATGRGDNENVGLCAKCYDELSEANSEDNKSMQGVCPSAAREKRECGSMDCPVHHAKKSLGRDLVMVFGKGSLDDSWDRMVLSNEGIRLKPMTRGQYLVCKVCGKEFANMARGMDGYIEHIKTSHPEYVRADKRE